LIVRLGAWTMAAVLGELLVWLAVYQINAAPTFVNSRFFSSAWRNDHSAIVSLALGIGSLLA